MANFLGGPPQHQRLAGGGRQGRRSKVRPLPGWGRWGGDPSAGCLLLQGGRCSRVGARYLGQIWLGCPGRIGAQPGPPGMPVGPKFDPCPGRLGWRLGWAGGGPPWSRPCSRVGGQRPQHLCFGSPGCPGATCSRVGDGCSRVGAPAQHLAVGPNPGSAVLQGGRQSASIGSDRPTNFVGFSREPPPPTDRPTS